MIPYTYLITHIPSGKRYYGVRFAKNCHPNDLWKTYYTSSKTVRKLIKLHGKESFTFQIRKIFNSKDKAVAWERRVLDKLDINSSNKWLNKTRSPCPAIHNVGIKHPMFGAKHNKIKCEVCNKLCASNMFYRYHGKNCRKSIVERFTSIVTEMYIKENLSISSIQAHIETQFNKKVSRQFIQDILKSSDIIIRNVKDAVTISNKQR
jgi:hypothetical protein